MPFFRGKGFYGTSSLGSEDGQGEIIDQMIRWQIISRVGIRESVFL